MPSGFAKTLVPPATGETIVSLPSVGFTAITPPFPRSRWNRRRGSKTRRAIDDGHAGWVEVAAGGDDRLVGCGRPERVDENDGFLGGERRHERSPGLKVTAPAGATSVWIARARTRPTMALRPTWRHGRSGGDRPRRLRVIIGRRPADGDPAPLPRRDAYRRAGGTLHCLDRVWQGAEVHGALLSDSLGDGPPANGGLVTVRILSNGEEPPRPGLSLHADVTLPAHAREQLEHLCRYPPALRGPPPRRGRLPWRAEAARSPGPPRPPGPSRPRPPPQRGPALDTARRHSAGPPERIRPTAGLRPSLARSPAQPRPPGRADAPAHAALPPRPLAPPQFVPPGRLLGLLDLLTSRLRPPTIAALAAGPGGNGVKVGSRHARGALGFLIRWRT